MNDEAGSFPPPRRTRPAVRSLHANTPTAR